MSDEIQHTKVGASTDGSSTLRSKLRELLGSASGQVLPLALAALALGSLLIVPFLVSISSKLQVSREIDRDVKYYYAADAAIEYTLHHLKCTSLGEITGTHTISVTVGGVSIPITITNKGTEEGGNLVDAMLVLDRSGSMDDDGYDDWVKDWQPIGNAKIAAKHFVDIMEEHSSPGASHQVGLVSYSDDITLDHPLTTTIGFTSVITAIDNLSAGGATNIGDAIAAAAEELQNNGRWKSKGDPIDSVKVIVLLSDGEANRPFGDPKQYAKDQADAACTGTSGGINFFSVALGEDVDKDLMRYIARDNKTCDPNNLDFYQESASSADLAYKFESIAFYLTASKWDLTGVTTGATIGEVKVETRAQVSKELDRINIITWCRR